ncbi:mannitol dehydrogenase family protein [Pelagibacterium limicola]|uniref:mannitol dehydrogenase family protein n=1 Tax=Pelagibacterium limicola TaxID=2791022 RepID=UPI0018AFCB9F|nr:mannitol dehydrogenase family protein [Pelagibacterium limicola]
MSRSVIQFGTSRFLQAHADLMLSEARDAGQDVGPVTVVETTGSPASRARVAAFAMGQSFPVRIRGLDKGVPLDETRQVRIVATGLSAREDPDATRAGFIDAAFVISNTGDKGYEIPARTEPTLEGWSSFPELLTALLRGRFQAGGAPITILPCELISRNGDTLRSIVLDLAARENDCQAFSDWIAERCLFINTLVDRIVSEPIDPIGAVAEPYALWVLEDQPGLTAPCDHEQIQVVPDLAPFERKKLFILNLAHTLLAQRWLSSGSPQGLTVRDAMAAVQISGWLDSIMREEVLPLFPASYGAEAYWAQCRERFSNPFLDHRLADIAQNHAAKIERRAGGFLDWVMAENGSRAACPRLRAAFEVA